MRWASTLACCVLASSCLLDIDLSLIDGADRDGGMVVPDSGASASCPSGMIATPACVDATEVTRAAYAEFVRGGDVASQGPRCRWNTDFTPTVDWPAPLGTEQWPVGGVDWCDAQSFCAWRGNRLCGGGSLAQAAAGEWAQACTQGGTRSYPYGDTFLAGACRGGSSDPAPVGTTAGCEGGFTGLRDMSGNVAEWLDACDDGPGQSDHNDLCAVLGGGYDGDPAALRCTASVSARRSSTERIRGFRCCDSPR